MIRRLIQKKAQKNVQKLLRINTFIAVYKDIISLRPVPLKRGTITSLIYSTDSKSFKLFYKKNQINEKEEGNKFNKCQKRKP